jgi:predicted ATPase
LLQSLDPKLRQQNLQRIVYGLLLAEAAQQPTLLVIDDFQWIDRASLTLLNDLIARLADREAQLLICIAHRPLELESGADASGQTYQAHTECPICTTVILDPLSDQASAELLNSQIPTLSHEADTHADWQQLKALILKNAQGNPLYIVEMAHALTENALVYDPATDSYSARAGLDRVQVPDTISRVILSRLDRLDEQSRNVLKVASVIGHEFQQWLLQAVYPYPALEPELARCLFDLCAKELLDRSQLLYLFRHVMTRQVAYESLLFAERQRLHRQIAECIEDQDTLEQADRTLSLERLHPSAEVLAHHYTLAQNWSRALRYEIQAGRRAQAIYANEDALHRYRQALQFAERVPGSQALQQKAHAALGDILTIVGAYDHALTHMDQAIHLVRTLNISSDQTARRLADLFCRTAAVYEKKSDYSTAFDWLHGGLLALEGTQVIEASRIYSMGAGIYHRQGDNAQALQWCENSLTLAGNLATLPDADKAQRDAARDALAHAYYLQGAIYLRYAEYARTVEVCQKSLGLYEQLGNLPGAGAAHNNLASAFFDLGDWTQAVGHYRQALQIATQIGNVHERGLIANNLGEVHRYRGDLEQAQTHYETSLQIWRSLGSLYGQAFLLMNLAAVALKRQEWLKAIEQLERSQRLCKRIDAEDFAAEAYRYLAEAHLGRGQDPGQRGHDQISRADEYARQSVRLAERQEMKLEEGATRRVLGRIHRTRGELQAAERELERSLETLESLDSQYQIGQTLVDLAMLYQEQDRPLAFQQSIDRAIALFEHLGARLDLERARQLQ